MFRAPGFEVIPLRTPTLPPASHTNCVICGRRGAVVVDPGSPYPAEAARLRRAVYELRGDGGTLQGVLLTHHHGDHTGGAAALAAELRVPLMAHPYTLARLGRPSTGLQALAVGEGDRLEVDGGRGLELLLTPGHAPGHLCLWDPEQRVLVAGDMVLGRGTTVIDPDGGGDMALYLASLERLLALAPRVVLPGHGPPLDRPAESLRRLMEHRRRRERRVLAALEPGPRDLLEITRLAYTDVPALLLPLAGRSALAHLIKLEQEGMARRSGAAAWALSPRTLLSTPSP